MDLRFFTTKKSLEYGLVSVKYCYYVLDKILSRHRFTKVPFVFVHTIEYRKTVSPAVERAFYKKLPFSLMWTEERSGSKKYPFPSR